VAQFVRDRDRLQSIATGGNQHKVRLRNQAFFEFAVAALTAHFKIQTHRSPAYLSDIHTDFQKIIQLRGPFEITLQVNARQPDIQLVKTLP